MYSAPLESPRDLKNFLSRGRACVRVRTNTRAETCKVGCIVLDKGLMVCKIHEEINFGVYMVSLLKKCALSSVTKISVLKALRNQFVLAIILCMCKHHSATYLKKELQVKFLFEIMIMFSFILFIFLDFQNSYVSIKI